MSTTTDDRFRGASAIVTGGGSGLGAATARLLAAKGVSVLVVDVNAQDAEAIATEDGIEAVVADVRDPDTVTDAVEAALRLGPLRIAVNCAGVPSLSRTIGRDGQYSSAHDLEAFRRVVEINLIGTFNVVRLAATAIARQEPVLAGERGVVLNTASVAATDGQIGQIAYSASKAAIVGSTLTFARDLAVVGIRVNTIAPGLIDTPIYGAGEDAEAFKAKLARDVVFPPRLGVPEEFAGMAWELIRNPYVNAEVVRVDGGIRLPPK